MNRARWFVALCAVAVALIASVVAAIPAGAVTATVTPSTDLADGQSVTITAEGFSPFASVGAAQCSAAVGSSQSTSDCDLSLSRTGNADESGRASFTIRVRATIFTPNATVDCVTAVQHCVVGIGDLNDLSKSAGGPITFDPDAPPLGPPNVTVTPDSDLVDQQEVTVAATGFSPGEWVAVMQCAVEDIGCDSSFLLASEQADSDGTISATVSVRRLIGAFEIVHDCANPGTCQMAVQVAGLPLGTAPITFDASEPLPDPPAVTVTPSDSLADRQIVTVTGSGFSPSSSVQLQECVDSGEPYLSCSSAVYRAASTDAAGNISTTLQARRTIHVYEHDGGESDIDCATYTKPCRIVATNWTIPFETASTPITFDPDAPLPPAPTMTASPTTGLVDGTSVAVTADGFPPGASLYIVQCMRDAVDANGCDLNRLGGAPADDNGHVTSGFTVARVLHLGSGATVDCASTPETCVLVVAFLGDTIDAAKTPLTFESGGPTTTDPTTTSGPADASDPAVTSDPADASDPVDTSTTTGTTSEALARTGGDTIDITAVAVGLIGAGVVVLQIAAIRRRTSRRTG